VTKKPLDYIAAPLRKLAVSIDELRPDPRNARRHDARNLGELEASLRRFGQRLPIIVRRAGMVVIVGNARLNLARRLGWSHLAAVILDDDEATARAYALADNRIGELGEWDDAGLAQTLLELSALDDDQALEGLGWTGDEVGAMVAELEHDLAGLEDEILGTPAPTDADDQQLDDLEVEVDGRVAEGDLWVCGDHRLLAADSFADGSLERVLGEDQVLAAVLTDPPYAVFGSSTGVSSDVADDKMIRPFFRELAELAARRLAIGGDVYVCCDWRSYPAVAESLRKRLEPKNLFVWDKGGYGLGTNYQNTYELVALFRKAKRGRTTWTNSRLASGARKITRPNLQRFSRVLGDEKEHNAQKPVELFAELLGNSTNAGDAVLDPFLGAGTTLIAAETLGRVCFGMDLEPKWVEVAIRRWESLTGKEATKAAATGAATP